ncbi:peptide-methionine (R)-S-oxide reductase MsrB [Parvibaculum sp.]|uniref:peptide-methionine (R)-S-oxide reductase MsrB n=1 Tax=Parvibaculum sp. TaxID=2024848 RepID=UPI002720D0E6|nr:peptide-methionine (R)-S-oxide reductase MsrB [Parvibaculum sp.]MDO9126163.1 peptide-methionine (R)-S-oxide reductase MsrB [Parvibaculum sp.]MDP1627440.1 peptide-methionine (R)-S-oxide reductase MsrB [Parvibaculum sp.]MDP2148619.1 peptide-methionine (R)-S-oxide reductase MsrB [Parvibaculum sp.]MDP3327576.1 peptide-methionine (R)-S-oxide reductase MsrB [Parvibaculum sp.]
MADTKQKLDKADDEWRSTLTPEQYAVTRQAGTERAFTGPWVNEHREGTYTCICCGEPLFRSDTKYESGSGWPSFYAPIQQGAVDEHNDDSHNMRRTEVVCAKCDAHLGHVFPDGPRPTGLRYCMNGTALDFKPDDTSEK